MTLRLTGEFECAPCHECGGKGTVPYPRVMAVRTLNNGKAADTAGEGCPIPCPVCRGKKVVIKDGQERKP